MPDKIRDVIASRVEKLKQSGWEVAKDQPLNLEGHVRMVLPEAKQAKGVEPEIVETPGGDHRLARQPPPLPPPESPAPLAATGLSEVPTREEPLVPPPTRRTRRLSSDD